MEDPPRQSLPQKGEEQERGSVTGFHGDAQRRPETQRKDSTETRTNATSAVGGRRDEGEFSSLI